MTSQDLIVRAHKELGVLAAGENLDGNQVQDGLDVLNDMLDTWNSESLMIYTTTPTSFRFTPNQQTYTVGPGGYVNIPRPSKIEKFTIIDDINNPVSPLELPVRELTTEQWASIAVKSISSQLPGNVYDDGNFPLRTLNYYYIPQVAIQALIYAWQPLIQFPNLTDDVSFPPGYAEALRTNLAVRLSPQYPDVPLSPITMGNAIEGKAKIMAQNTDPIDLKCDNGVLDVSTSFYGSANRALFISGQ